MQCSSQINFSAHVSNMVVAVLGFSHAVDIPSAFVHRKKNKKTVRSTLTNVYLSTKGNSIS